MRVLSKNSSVVILLRFSNGSGYLPSHGQMAWDPHWDTAIHGSHAPGVGTGEPGASAATRRVEGARAAAAADGDGPDLLGFPIEAVDELATFAAGSAAGDGELAGTGRDFGATGRGRVGADPVGPWSVQISEI